MYARCGVGGYVVECCELMEEANSVIKRCICGRVDNENGAGDEEMWSRNVLILDGGCKNEDQFIVRDVCFPQ